MGESVSDPCRAKIRLGEFKLYTVSQNDIPMNLATTFFFSFQKVQSKNAVKKNYNTKHDNALRNGKSTKHSRTTKETIKARLTYVTYIKCSSYECFVRRAVRLSNKLLGQGYVNECLRSSLRKFYGRYGDLIKHMRSPSPECYTTFWMMTIYSDTLH